MPILFNAEPAVILAVPLPAVLVMPNTNLSSVEAPINLFKPACTRYSTAPLAAAFVAMAHVGTDAYAGLLANSLKLATDNEV